MLRVDLYELEAEIVAEIELPGFAPGEIEFVIDPNLLSLRLSRSAPITGEGRTYYRQHRLPQEFFGHVELPVRVQPEAVQAFLEAGVLQVRFATNPQRDLVVHYGITSSGPVRISEWGLER